MIINADALVDLIEQRVVLWKWHHTREQRVKTGCPKSLAERLRATIAQRPLPQVTGMAYVPLMMWGKDGEEDETITKLGYHAATRTLLELNEEVVAAVEAVAERPANDRYRCCR